MAYYAGRIAGGIFILGGGAFAWLRLHDEGRTVARNVAEPLKDFTYATIGIRDAQGRIAQALAAIACVAYMALMTQVRTKNTIEKVETSFIISINLFLFCLKIFMVKQIQFLAFQ